MSKRPRLTVEALERRELLSTYVVTNNFDDGATVTHVGSLRWAVVQSEYVTPGFNIIKFNLPAGERVITLNSSIFLNNPIVLDGTTQPGYAGQPLVTVVGGAGVKSLIGLVSGSSGSTIQGLAFSDMPNTAISIFAGSDGNWIQDNWIGFWVDGAGTVHTTNASNVATFSIGVAIQSNWNVVRNNTISGLFNGMALGEDDRGTWSGATYSGNLISGNKMGTDPTGSTSGVFANLTDAIFFGFGVVGNTVQYNVMSGNRLAGLEAANSSSITGNVVLGNLIGTDATGMKPIANGIDGVLFRGATNTAILNNLFGANGYAAISIGDVTAPTPASGIFIQNNWIGLAASGTAAFNQGVAGITIINATGLYVAGNVVSGITGNAIAMVDTTHSYFVNNAFGVGFAGNLPNSAYGIAFGARSTYNYAAANFFGGNLLGTYYVDPTAVGTYVDVKAAAAGAQGSVQARQLASGRPSATASIGGVVRSETGSGRRFQLLRGRVRPGS